MIRVLIVDDEPFIRQGLGLLIDWKQYGYMIAGEAANGKEAIELLKENYYHLVITDIKMPELDGMELIEWIRINNMEHMKIIVLSGYYEFEYAKKAIQYNVTDYILKPIQHQELVSTLIAFKKEYDEGKVTRIGLKTEVQTGTLPIRMLIKDMNEEHKGEEEVCCLSQDTAQQYGIKKEDIDELIQYTKENNGEEMERCIHKICASLRQHYADSRIIDIYLNYLLCQLIHLAREFEQEINQIEVLENINTRALEQFVVEGSPKHFTVFMNEYAKYLNQLRSSAVGGVLEEIEKEIMFNYNKNLSLKSLSEKYYINSAYLGQIFKKKYGIAFKDYLNNYRIEKATELLLRTDNKVYMIAEAVGYNNLDYFINKFVKYQGKTPLQYRRQFFCN